jgi:septal ring factor EnvC (AmiA/AmiB activator)
MDIGRQELFPGDALWGTRISAERTRAAVAANFQKSLEEVQKSLEVAENNRAQLQTLLETAEQSRSAIEAQLHFCEHENEALLVGVRAAKAENQLVWEAIARHEDQNRILQDALNEANQRLAAVPWRIVRIWFAIRRRVPKPILRFIGALLARRR